MKTKNYIKIFCGYFFLEQAKSCKRKQNKQKQRRVDQECLGVGFCAGGQRKYEKRFREQIFCFLIIIAEAKKKKK